MTISDPTVVSRTRVRPLPRAGGILGEPDRSGHVWRPGRVSLVCFGLALVGLWAVWRGMTSDLDAMTVFTTIVWTLPVLITAQGFAGLLVTERRIGGGPAARTATDEVDDLLVVVIPTVARADTLVALDRVLRSCCEHLAARFTRMRVDIVVDEGSAGAADVERLADRDPRVRVVTVPRTYRTPNGTRYKARANHYAQELRRREGEARDDVWVLHLDDDTGVGTDTAEALARFVGARRAADDGTHLAQGVLTYPRELAANQFTWLADAIRPACDITIFAASTGTGSPRAGLHGELLCVRASVEAAIGWDFGPGSIVEDAEFALRFCHRFPGGSEWLPGRSYGASPATLGAFVRQRARWVRGLLDLARQRDVPLRCRILLTHNVYAWACAPAAHPLVVLLLAIVLRDADTLPATAALLPVWTLNMTFWLYLYWEGLRLNVLSSDGRGRRWWELVAVVGLMPLFALLETAGIVRGIVAAVRGGDPSFTVIAKPR